MKGIQISLTGKERQCIIDALNEFIEIYDEGMLTSIELDGIMDNGLGKAMFKLYKGLRGESLYEKYNK